MGCVDCEVVRLLETAKRGVPIVIPRGARVHSTHPQQDGATRSRRAQTITPSDVFRYSDGSVEVRWAGAGGYWRWINGNPSKHVTLWLPDNERKEKP